MGWVQLSSLVRPERHGTVCIIGPKGKARIHGLHVSSGLYIQEVIYMGWVQLSSLVRPKRQGTACVIGPKGEARIHGPYVSSVPKVKLGHSDHVRHRVFIFRKLFTWVGFNYHPWLGPKDTKLRASLVPKAKIGYTDRVHHRFNYPPSKCLKKLL